MKRSIGALLLGGLLLLGAGCTHQPRESELDRHWGESSRATREGMIENPYAGNERPVTGLDGRSVERVIENYDKNQRNQEHPRPSKKGGSGILIGEFE